MKYIKWTGPAWLAELDARHNSTLHLEIVYQKQQSQRLVSPHERLCLALLSHDPIAQALGDSFPCSSVISRVGLIL